MFLRMIALASLCATISAASLSAGESARPEKEFYYVPVNLSLVPQVSAHRYNGPNTESNVAVNVFVGSGGKLNGIEFGGVMNMEEENVNGAQFAGCVNMVHGELRGVQSSGAANVVDKGVYGVQFAEVVNTAGTLQGAQFSGAANIVRDNSRGTQFAGVLNSIGGSSGGAQFAGVVNIAKKSSRIAQFSGVCNIAQGCKGFQLSGVANFADNITGSQISLINIARKVDGAQIGLINIADEVNGAPIGLFSYVKSVGLHYQFFIDETGFGNSALRCGGKNVYTLLNASVQGKSDMGKDNFTWSLGYGLGVRYDISNRFYVNADVMAQLLQHQNAWEEDLNVITRYRAGGGFRVNEHFALIGGLTANKLLSRVESGSGIVPGWLSKVEKKGDTWHRFWPGVYLGFEL